MNTFDEATHTFLTSLSSNQHPFDNTLQFIEEWFAHTPSAFRNGPIENGISENQASGKVLALAELLSLNHQQLLCCFGEHYRNVMATPDADNHFNLRYLVKTNDTHVEFDQFPLTRKATAHG